MKDEGFLDFIEAPLRLQLALDVFLPPTLLLLAWIIAEIRSRFYRRPVLRLSLNECKFYLCMTYVCMFGLTIYSRFFR